MNDAIDFYLDGLGDQLGRRVVDSARLIEEAEQHLRDTQQALVEAGWHDDAAAAEAVERFGGPTAVARHLPLIGGPVGRQVAAALAPMAVIAMVAAGVGGVLALGLSWVDDAYRMAGPSRASLWLQVIVGVLGLGVLESSWRRRAAGRSARPSGLPARFVPAAGLVSFGLATVALVAYGVLLVWWDRSHHMPRSVFTALACLGVAICYGVQFAHRNPARRSL